MSCGGEQDPKRCIIKGYRPEGGIAYYYEQRLRGWCNDNNVNFVEAPRALATSHYAGTPTPTPAPSTVGPQDSVSVVGSSPTALASFDPSSTTWRFVNGTFQPVNSMALVAPTALISFGGRKPLAGEIDVIVDGACTTIGTIPTSELLTNLRAPEIPGMFVGNNNWLPATATGDLVTYAIDADGAVAAFTRTRHVVPGLQYHLHGETAEFKQHGGVTRKDTTLTITLPDDTELLLLPQARTTWCASHSSPPAEQPKPQPSRLSRCMPAPSSALATSSPPNALSSASWDRLSPRCRRRSF
jgi:hypothetical protein